MTPATPTRRDLLLAAGAAAVALPAAAADAPKSDTHLPHAKPEEIGLDGKRLQTAYDLLEKWTTGANAPIPGGALLVGRAGKVVPPRFFGRMGPESDAPPIRKDGLFLMASITKPVTYLGAMLLVERGPHLERPDTLAVLPVVPDEWLGQGVELHDAPTDFGAFGFAVRWHGDRPALLWELDPVDPDRQFRLTAPGLDPDWSSTQPTGEALLSARALPVGEGSFS